LNVPRHATQDEIGHAYRALLRRHHPDTRAASGEKQAAQADAALQQILAAYTVLRDPARRADYDRATRPLPQPQLRRTSQPDSRDRPRAQPPIVAGPVYWRPASHER
jgi:DnaJ-class molecular chaperone